MKTQKDYLLEYYSRLPKKTGRRPNNGFDYTEQAAELKALEEELTWPKVNKEVPFVAQSTAYSEKGERDDQILSEMKEQGYL